MHFNPCEFICIPITSLPIRHHFIYYFISIVLLFFQSFSLLTRSTYQFSSSRNPSHVQASVQAFFRQPSRRQNIYSFSQLRGAGQLSFWTKPKNPKLPLFTIGPSRSGHSFRPAKAPRSNLGFDLSIWTKSRRRTAPKTLEATSKSRSQLAFPPSIWSPRCNPGLPLAWPCSVDPSATQDELDRPHCRTHPARASSSCSSPCAPPWSHGQAAVHPSCPS